jgi:hypothetical protein
MDNILILGYFFRNNLGDDLFHYCLDNYFKQIIPNTNIIFANPDDIDEIPKVSAVLIGGGDLINDYFMTKIRTLLQGSRAPVYGIGVGFPYPQLATKEYLNIFDVIAHRTDIVIPDEIVSYRIPDLVRMLPTIPKKTVPTKIGVFLANSICSPTSSLVHKLVDVIDGVASRLSRCFGTKYQIVLYAMNTSGSEDEDDNILNRAVYNLLNRENVSIVETPIAPEKAVALFSEFYMTMCTRFHAHILSLMTETPFISLYSTEKVKDLLTQENLLHLGEAMVVDPITLKPLNFNPTNVLRKFDYVEKNWKAIRTQIKLSNVVKEDEVKEMKVGIENLLFYKPKFGEKLLARTCWNIYKFLTHSEYKDVSKTELFAPGFFSRQSSPDVNFISQVVSFVISKKDTDEFSWGLQQQITKHDFSLKEAVKWILQSIPHKFEHWNNDTTENPMSHRLFNFGYFDKNLLLNVHRSGWQFLVDNIWRYQNPNGMIFDVYSDKTFGWQRQFYTKIGVLPFKQKWVGVLHHTPDTLYTDNNLTNTINSKEFIDSLSNCVGLIVLSNYLKDWLTVRIPNVPIFVIHHPTEFIETSWSIEKWNANKDKKVVQIGAWMRNSYGIYCLPNPTGIRKFALKGKEMDNYFAPSNYFDKLQDAIGIDCLGVDGPCRIGAQKSNKFMFGMLEHLKEQYSKVAILNDLSNDEYDELLVSNVVFLNLIDVSACNTIIECIVRNTPILVNRLPAVVEYLGNDYPLYYNSFEEVYELLTDNDMLLKAHKYLVNKDKTFLTIENFIEKLKLMAAEL